MRVYIENPAFQELLSEFYLQSKVTSKTSVAVLDDLSRCREILDRTDVAVTVIFVATNIEEAGQALEVGVHEFLVPETLHLLPLVVDKAMRVSEMRHQLATTESRIERIESIFNASSDAIILTRQDGSIRQVNIAFDALFRYAVDETYAQPLEILVIPEEELAITKLKERVADTGKPGQMETMGRRKDGTTFNADVRLSLITQQGASGFVCLVRDITDRKQAEQALLRREQILSAVNFAAEQFLGEGDWRARIDNLLELLGLATDVSRVYVFQNSFDQQGVWFAGLHYEWVAKGVQSHVSSPDFKKIPMKESGYERWKMLGEGQIIYGNRDDFPAAERGFLEARDTQSMAMVPVFVVEKWWGFMGFDICDRPHTWLNTEVETLQTAANILGAAIRREQTLQALRASEHRYRAVVEDQTELVCRYDTDGVLTFVNEAYCRYYDRNSEELIGRGFLNTVAEDERLVIAAHIASLSADKPIDMLEHRRTLPNGEIRWQQWTHRAIFDDDGKIIEYQGVGRDITDRKRAEAERERLIEDLNAFAHTVAHDLKNPLSVIIGYSGLLKAANLDIQAVHQQFLETINRTGQKMSEIISEMLRLAQLRQVESLDMEPVDMGRIVGEVQQRLVVMIEKYEAEVIVPDHWPDVLGHAAWLEEVWANYVSNAVKYGGRPPRVEIGATTKSNGMVRFWVRDNGEGLTEEESDQLFGQFKRLDRHAESSIEGTGLGLSIVKRIVEKLGGDVGLETAPGQGSTFWFELRQNHPG